MGTLQARCSLSKQKEHVSGGQLLRLVSVWCGRVGFKWIFKTILNIRSEDDVNMLVIVWYEGERGVYGRPAGSD